MPGADALSVALAGRRYGHRKSASDDVIKVQHLVGIGYACSRPHNLTTGNTRMKIVVTGASSRLAQALIPLLLDEDRVEQVIGMDQRDVVIDDPRYTHILLDMRSAQVARLLAQADAVVHLALAEDNTLGVRAALHASRREERLLGSQNVFLAANLQRVKSIVHVSSAAVYELPARERPIGEAHPRAALPGIALAEDQVAFEAWLDEFEVDHTDIRLVRLRPHLMIGTQAARHNRMALRLPFYVKLAAPSKLQCVHEDDVLRAILLALFKPVTGAFNLACGNNATLREIQRRSGGGWLPVPFFAARGLLHLAQRLGRSPDASWLEAARHDIVLDTTRARRRLGWKPQYDSIAACLKAVE